MSSSCDEEVSNSKGSLFSEYDTPRHRGTEKILYLVGRVLVCRPGMSPQRTGPPTLRSREIQTSVPSVPRCVVLSDAASTRVQKSICALNLAKRACRTLFGRSQVSVVGTKVWL